MITSFSTLFQSAFAGRKRGQGAVGKEKAILSWVGSDFVRSLLRLGGFLLAGDNAMDRCGADAFVQAFLAEEAVES